MNENKRIIDTFTIRELSQYEKKPSLESFLEASRRSGEDLSLLRRKRKR